jgi:hypothetical protein
MDEAKARHGFADTSRLARAAHFVGAGGRSSLELSKRTAEVVEEPFQSVQLDAPLGLRPMQFEDDALVGCRHEVPIPDPARETRSCKDRTSRKRAV